MPKKCTTTTQLTDHQLDSPLLKERLRRSMSGMEMAKMCGISRQLYYYYEKGMSKPGRLNLDKMCHVFKIRKEDYIEWFNKKTI